MSRTWIVYNKPEEPNAIHAGLLLALGLHGHLGVLTITDIYQYYSQVSIPLVFDLFLFVFLFAIHFFSISEGVHLVMFLV